jgi:hypothetical protein
VLADQLIHQFHTSAEQLAKLALMEEDKQKQSDMIAKARLENELARDVNHAVRYWLDIKQVERFRAARFRHDAFPPMIHDKLIVEFNGMLCFDFRPWQRSDIVIQHGDVVPEIAPLQPRHFSADLKTAYKAVFVQRYDPPHKFISWPDEPVFRIWWFEKPMWIHVPPGEAAPEGNYPLADNYTVTFCKSTWPRVMDAMNVRQKDEATHPGENAHGERLFATTVNLLCFLAAENIVRVRIKPKHHQRNDLKGLPKSDREYYVLPFQLPRYRYLHPEESQPTGRHVSICFDVEGHARHLLDERYERNPDGTARVIWVNPHQRGLGKPYRPAVRRGTIESLFLDYDEFIRGEETRMKKGRNQ